MNPVQKALWYIESHFADEVSLEVIAEMGGVSRFHLARAFAAATGRPIMRYVRARRLSEAAKALCEGAPDILSVALEAGYTSHEAFTRAFRDQFGLTPDAVRSQRRPDNLNLVEPITMDSTPLETLQPPRIENGKALLLAGIAERYNCEESGGIPAQWQRFAPHLGNIPGQIGSVAYGVRYNEDEAGNMDYMCGVEVADFSNLPPDFSRLRLAAQRYAVFFHPDHVSTIRRTWSTIYNCWLPQSRHALADAPSFERYDERFDPRTGHGGFEIWLPIAS
jgi:AraC family transcriptional regulator